MSDIERKYIERKLARSRMSEERKEEIREQTKDLWWTIRCWNCRAEQEVQLEHIGACSVCGKNLGVRE